MNSLESIRCSCEFARDDADITTRSYNRGYRNVGKAFIDLHAYIVRQITYTGGASSADTRLVKP